MDTHVVWARHHGIKPEDIGIKDKGTGKDKDKTGSDKIGNLFCASLPCVKHSDPVSGLDAAVSVLHSLGWKDVADQLYQHFAKCAGENGRSSVQLASGSTSDSNKQSNKAKKDSAKGSSSKDASHGGSSKHGSKGGSSSKDDNSKEGSKETKTKSNAKDPSTATEPHKAEFPYAIKKLKHKVPVLTGMCPAILQLHHMGHMLFRETQGSADPRVGGFHPDKWQQKLLDEVDKGEMWCYVRVRKA